MTSRSSKFTGLHAGFIVIVVALGCATQPPPVVESLPPIQPSRFLNAEADAQYVGEAACIACHTEAHESYLETAHSQALAEVDLSVEPPDGEFFDPRSQKRYRIVRRDGRMYHQESIRTESGEDLQLAEFPVRYRIGSGRFSRSYLVEIDGFLYESPATWYAAKPGWALSPGYEKSNSGFQRPVEFRCLLCHAGRLEPVDNSPQRVNLQALVIDCERCHGPGGSHVAKWRDSPQLAPAEDAVDETIVNPAHLDRRLREDICAQCHLHSAATVELAGRRLQDFRPGLRLADFVAHYGVHTQADEMHVVGHAEQMRLSRCYEESETLTCTTCHQPHAKPSRERRMENYRANCQACHAGDACTETLESRRADGIADNCIHCHMPKSATEIPHFAFTHHRIGIHTAKESAVESQQAAELVAMDDDSWQPKLDRDRNRGLAYLQFSDAPGQGPFAVEHRRRAKELLERVQRDRPDDADVVAALARLSWGQDADGTLRHAHHAAKLPQRSPEADATISFTLGSTYFQQDQPSLAIPWLEQTTKLRPTADVWHQLSACYAQTSDMPAAVEAARRSATLAPDRPRYVEHLANSLRRSGADEEAALIERRIPALRAYRQRVDR